MAFVKIKGQPGVRWMAKDILDKALEGKQSKEAHKQEIERKIAEVKNDK